MVTVNESVQISESEIKTAIVEWLERNLGHKYNVTIHHRRSTSGEGWGEVDRDHFSAVAQREVQGTEEKKHK